MDDPIIKADHLRVIYNQGKSNEVRSLEDVSVAIFPQEYVIIHGPSGCGKSTLLYSIAALQAPTYGDMIVEGKSLVKMENKGKIQLHRTGIGMIFQAFYLIPSLNVIDNVCLPKLFMGESIKKRREAGFRLLQRFGIAEQADKFPNQLSGGQKQRVAIARALINNPQIILADEPVGNLDSESAQNVLDILKELNSVDKKTVIMVTHNPEHLQYADRVISMKDGKIIGEEVIVEKRPEIAIKERKAFGYEEIPNELKILMRTFKNLTASQVGVLLVPFKAKQLFSHVLAELTEEQSNMAENLIKELLFHNIDAEMLKRKLDLKFEKGGADWNKKRAESFVKRIKGIVDQVEILESDMNSAVDSIADHLLEYFHITLQDQMKLRLKSFLRMRLENKIDKEGLQKKLDSSRLIGGVNLNKSTAEKFTREVEMMMLLKYST